MPILPIDTGRYGTLDMKRIFEEENRLQRMLDVEAALAWAHSEVENIPRKDAEKIVQMASVRYVKLGRVKEIEREIKHDVMALVRALAEVCGSSGTYVHLGATSSDILDTASALQLKEVTELIMQRLNELERTLLEGAEKYKKTIMIGRTHGQHALPTTLGFKLALWMRQHSRNIQRFCQCSERLLVGKMSGAVGTQAGLGPNAVRIQELVMKRLGIKPAEISSQIVPRDLYGELVCLLAVIASTLDNIATEIRELQRTEIGELFEPFEKERQVGSSTMPHKRNPELCERICGLAKIMRGLVVPALENIPTWHERDLTQSSSERFILPEACILTDYMLFLMTKVLKNLEVDEKRMLRNLGLTQARMMSEAVMLALVSKGVGRQEAYELVRGLAIKSETKKSFFKEILLKNDVVGSTLSEIELDKALNPKNYIGTAVEQVELAIKKTCQERKVRGLVESY
ncbi:MAG: adenylosuccinate lyase [Candidatus Bathyarchaeota archaeon]|nr:adenylosuccinate lyase [Candidatus Bathyarchaeota archaeon]MDH5732332.1 adenylosuccinate lyase [Candidatus Bathyarchaeota archaeon]